jgi:hypothetical protein
MSPGAMTIGVGIVQINVTDLDIAWTFYVDTLGIPGRRRLGVNKPFELDIGPPTVLVYPVSQIVPRPYPDSTGVTLVFHTNDIVNTVSSWRTKGVHFIPIAWAPDPSGIAPTPFGPFIAFQDPFMNVHELLQPVLDS